MSEISNAEAIKAWSSLPREIIEDFGDEGDFIRKNLLNPVIFSLLGDVSGKIILDAGCGQGYLSRLLARKGAIVTGVEPVQGLYDYAIRREQAQSLGITYLQEDLAAFHSMPGNFDYVIANMVFMDIPDYVPALRNCITALKPGGGLIFSLLHPCFEEPGAEWYKKGYVEVRDYFQEQAAKQTYGYFFHRPLSVYLNVVIEEGCILRKVIEPRLDEAIAVRRQAERYMYVPGYIVIYATKIGREHAEELGQG